MYDCHYRSTICTTLFFNFQWVTMCVKMEYSNRIKYTYYNGTYPSHLLESVGVTTPNKQMTATMKNII